MVKDIIISKSYSLTDLLSYLLSRDAIALKKRRFLMIIDRRTIIAVLQWHYLKVLKLATVQNFLSD